MSKDKITLEPGMEVDVQDGQVAGTPPADQGVTQEPTQAPAPQEGQKGKKKKKADAGEDGHYVHKLKPPFVYGGTTYTVLTFDYTRLTGDDMLAVESELQSRQVYALSPEISRHVHCLLAAKAANVGDDVISALPLPDFNKITSATRNFLLKALGDDEEETEE